MEIDFKVHHKRDFTFICFNIIIFLDIKELFKPQEPSSNFERIILIKMNHLQWVISLIVHSHQII